MGLARFTALCRSLPVAALLAACSGGPTDQSEAIPAGSGTLAAGATRVDQSYTGTLAASGDSRTTRPHWTFAVDAKATSTATLGEGPHARLSLTSDQSTIPVTQDLTLSGGSGTGQAKVEFDADCTSIAACSQGFKVRFERKDSGAGEIALTWTGTIATSVKLSLGQVPPGDLSVTSP
jgi:hypothetical protein